MRLMVPSFVVLRGVYAPHCGPFSWSWEGVCASLCSFYGPERRCMRLMDACSMVLRGCMRLMDASFMVLRGVYAPHGCLSPTVLRG